MQQFCKAGQVFEALAVLRSAEVRDPRSAGLVALSLSNAGFAADSVKLLQESRDQHVFLQPSTCQQVLYGVLRSATLLWGYRYMKHR